MKIIAACILFFILPLISHAQETPELITSKFFGIYKAQGFDKGIDYLFSTNKHSPELKAAIDNLKLQFGTISGKVGSYYGYEVILKKTAGTSLALLTCMVKHDKEILTFRMLFYKPENAWRAQSFKFDNNLSDELEEASKPYGATPPSKSQ